MDILDYEEEKNNNISSAKKQIIYWFLISILLILVNQIELIPSLHWLQIILYFLLMASIFMFLCLIPSISKNTNKIFFDFIEGITFFAWIFWGLGMLAGLAFSFMPSTYTQKLETVSGTFYVQAEGIATSSTFYEIKKSYPYSPILHSLDGWQIKSVTLNIQLDTSNNFVFANNEPIWNLTTDEFIPRTTTLNR